MASANTEAERESSLVQLLARRARGATDARLVVDAVLGFIVALAAVLARGPGWNLFAAAGICFMSFGVWGIADRERSEHADGTRAARLLGSGRWVAAITGFAAALVLAVGALAILIGRVIS